MFNWNEIKQEMKTGVVLVTFTKANGDERVMECTLAEYLLPETTQPSSNNEDVCVVFDLEANAWRSFRYDRVTSVEIIE